MKQSILSALIMLCTYATSQSQNLVPNPSFEEYLECPQSTGELQQQVVDWYSWNLSPDYFNQCNNLGLGSAGVPNNAWGFQSPVDGVAYSGVITYAQFIDNEREYMAAPLLDTLTIGELYYLRFYASMFDGAAKEDRWCAVSNIGMRLFKDPVYDEQFNTLEPDNFAHLNYSQILGDYENWTLIEGWFTANQAYNWVAIGNFFTDSNTEILILNENDYCAGIIYIENICIALSPKECDMSLSSSTHFDQNVPVAYPNPAADEVRLKNHSGDIETVHLIDVHGRLIKTWVVSQIEQILDVSTVSRGIYMLRISSSNKISNLKLLLQ